MSILVIGGTGTVGRPVVQGLLAKGEAVRVLTRSADKADALPLGVHGIIGDLRKPKTLRWAMKGVDRVFLLTPLSPTEAEEGLEAVAAANQAGVRHLVYLSIHHVDHAPYIPHFKSKLEVHKALRDSGMPFTLIMANNLFQNDLAYRDAILTRLIYPQPIGAIGLNRVDARDIADAAVNALTQSGHEFRCYPLVGVAPLTGRDVAQIYSDYLRREIRYGGYDLEAWSREAGRTQPQWLVHTLKKMYHFFNSEGSRASEDDLLQQAKVLGKPPRSFCTFVRETVRAGAEEARREHVTARERNLAHTESKNLCDMADTVRT